MQNYIQQGSVNPDATVVFDKAELTEPVHEEAHSGPCCSDHFRQCLLGYLWNQRLRFARSSELRHQQENACQTPFAGVEELVDEVCLGSHAAGQQKFQEQVRKLVLLVHYANHLFPAYLQCGAGGDRLGRGQTQPVRRRERLFSHKIACRKERDGGFLASLGDHRDLCAAILEIEDGIRRVSLRKERFLGTSCTIFRPRPAWVRKAAASNAGFSS